MGVKDNPSMRWVIAFMVLYLAALTVLPLCCSNHLRWSIGD